MVKNFVSVSAVSDRKELAEIGKISKTERFEFPIVIGYQVSNSSINQGSQNSRQPKFTELGNLDRETRDYGLITAVHYYTKNNDTIVEDLEKVIESGVESSSALLQFNTLPPSLDILKKVGKMGFEIIFKVAVSDKQSSQRGYAVWKGEDVQDVERGEVVPLVNQVYDRRDVISYVMFDPSHGTNLDLNLDEGSLAVRFGKEITARGELDNLGLVYAGGINPKNVGKLGRKLNSFFPNRISVDVESGVRVGNKLDLDLVKDYLINYQDALKN
ncbi:hypothetical protein HOE04_04440 [archaeon]|jgi:hypothetical protein|nr:hypothetical protein [archaeon]